MLKRKLAAVALASALGAGQAIAADVVDQSFYPYRESVPTFPGMDVGMTINAGNAAQFEKAIDPAVFQMVKDGWLELTVGETTSFDLHPNYVEATRKSLGQVSLGAEPGQINGFAGCFAQVVTRED